ncbi:MAG: DNA polymerase III subunit gamma/tau, partial [Alphaproteobacteria bacterium]|nr:DNA polymerase III subunit gamma/tau [Alphaproteobacteria bacterium]
MTNGRRRGTIAPRAGSAAALARAVALVREAAAVPEDGGAAWATERRAALDAVLHDLSQLAAGQAPAAAPAPAPAPTSKPPAFTP